MSKELSIFTIVLSPPVPVFHAGQVVQGTVLVHLNSPMKMRGIHLQFYGGSNVHWTERHSRGSGKSRRTVTVHYRAAETYFVQNVKLFGKDQGQMSGSNPVVEAGEYQYPFQFQLPATLPSNFEGLYGNVRYFLKATIDKAWKFDDTFKLPFTVIGILDLNQIPEVRTPVGGQDEKMICCWCCASGPIQANLSVERTGFVPGEFIFVTGEIWNNSSRKINDSVLILEQTVTYRATNKNRTRSHIVSEVRRPGIEPYGKDSYENFGVHVPPLPPSYLSGCNIIHLQYVLKLIVRPYGLAFNLAVPLPVTIGTIPLQNIHPIFSQSAYTPGMASIAPEADELAIPFAPPQPDPSFVPPSGGPTAPPPTYAECGFGRANLKDESDDQYTRGNLEWAPTYTYYTWGQQPPAGAQQPPGGFQPPPGGFQQPPPYDPQSAIAPVHS